MPRWCKSTCPTMAASIAIRPQPGPQEEFLSTAADIAIYGGQAGGGKSYGLLLEPLRHIGVPGFGSVIFRRTTPQIRNKGGLWDESGGLYRLLGAAPREQMLDWTWANGVTVKFAHLEHEGNKNDWQGAQIPLIGFDELTHFTESQFWYMLSRNRSVCGVRPYVRATTNADATSWVATLIAWWIDQDTGYPIPERAGKLRWFIRVNDELRWADDPAELRTLFPEIVPKSLTFIPAKLEDNRILQAKDPSYRANLMALPTVERERLLGGNWKIVWGNTPFPADKFQRGDPPSDRPLKYFICLDLAYTTNAHSDCTAWAIGATDPDNHLWVIEAAKAKLTPEQILDKIFTLYRRFRGFGLNTIHVEGHLVVETLVQREMLRRNEWFKLEPLKHGGVAKKDRIYTIEPALKFMWFGAGAQAAVDELTAWSEASTVDDLSDAIAYLRRVAMPAPKRTEQVERPRTKAYQALERARRGESARPKFKIASPA